MDHSERELELDLDGGIDLAASDEPRELSFDSRFTAGEDDTFMQGFRGIPESDEPAGARHNPFLRVAYGRKLLDYEQERELGRRLSEARVAMTHALSAFGACHRYLIAEWDKAVVAQRSPGEVLQWPSGTSSQAGGNDDAGGDSGARERMAALAMAHSCRTGSGNAADAVEAPLDLRALFVEAGPAFSMLCELGDVARRSLDAAPARLKGRAGLERHLEAAAAARMRFQEARRVMLESNLRLVFSIAGKFVNNGIGYDDLVQEGSIGLLRAIEKFEPALGFKFSTYASTWIWQAVTRAIANQRRTVRVPAHVHDKMLRVRSIAARIQQSTGVEPGVSELAKACDMSTEVVTRALNAANRTLSLDAPLRAGEDTSLIDLASDDDQPDSIETMQRSELERIVRQAVDALPEREATILRLRLGLGGTEEHTLEQIGTMLGITRERTRQLQNRAFEALRTHLKDVGAALTW